MAIHYVASWKTGLFSQADPQKVYEEIRQIQDNSGNDVCTPQELVDFARNNPNSESSLCFDWDKDVAANNWWKKQARDIMNNLITIEVKEKVKEPPKQIKLIHNVTKEEGYKPREVVIQHPNEMQQLTNRAWLYLKDWLHSYDIVTDPDIVDIRNYIKSKMP